MAEFLPLVLNGNDLERLQAGDDINLGTGDILAAAGTFSGNVSVVDLNATGDVSADSGDVSAATGTFSGQVSVGSLMSTGAVSGTSGTFSAVLEGYDPVFLTELTNESGSGAVIGEPVYQTDTAREFDKSIADTESTAKVVGLVQDTSISDTAAGDVQTQGVLTATTGQWDAVTGGTGGLTPGTTYYLSDATAGRLVDTPPTTVDHYIVQLGTALSATEMLLEIAAPQRILQLDADLELFIDPSGDDDTGDGSSGSPYATLQRAQEHYAPLVPGNNTITVNLGEGEHDHDAPFTMVYPFGAALRFVGEAAELFLNVDVTNIDGSATSDATLTNLEWIEFDIDLSGLSGTAAAAGDMVRLAAGSGGTNPEALEGTHEIQSVASGIATVRAFRADGTTELPSGAMTVSGFIFRSVVNFTGNTDGVVVQGPVSSGQWQDVVIKGNDTASTNSKNGLVVIDGGSFAASDSIVITHWSNGVVCTRNGLVETPGLRVSRCQNVGVSASTSGTVRCQTSTRINGCNSAISANNGGKVIANTGRLIATARSAAIAAQLNGVVTFANGLILYDDGSATGILAEDASTVLAVGATITGFSTDSDPADGVEGNRGSYVFLT